MSAAPFLLRCKAKTGQHVINSLTLNSTVDDLKLSIEKLTSIPRQQIRIKVGYPPKAIEALTGSEHLRDLPICSGDTLIVDELEHSSGIRQGQKDKNKMVRVVVPADNSCLFTSVNYVMEGVLDVNAGTALRELIATVVMSDPETFTEAYLNQSNEDYRRWITLQDTWGGAIEVAILAKYYSFEICVVDTQSGRIDRFGEDQEYENRVFLIYDGIHYDALALETPNGTRTQFSTNEDNVVALALQLADEAKANRQFTDVNQFSLRCLVCNKALKGQAEARDHARETSHTNFGEY